MIRITVTLKDDERVGLLALSRNERRDARQQAAVLIRESLEQRGLLNIELAQLETVQKDVKSEHIQ